MQHFSSSSTETHTWSTTGTAVKGSEHSLLGSAFPLNTIDSDLVGDDNMGDSQIDDEGADPWGLGLGALPGILRGAEVPLGGGPHSAVGPSSFPSGHTAETLLDSSFPTSSRSGVVATAPLDARSLAPVSACLASDAQATQRSSAFFDSLSGLDHLDMVAASDPLSSTWTKYLSSRGSMAAVGRDPAHVASTAVDRAQTAASPRPALDPWPSLLLGAGGQPLVKPQADVDVDALVTAMDHERRFLGASCVDDMPGAASKRPPAIPTDVPPMKRSRVSPTWDKESSVGYTTRKPEGSATRQHPLERAYKTTVEHARAAVANHTGLKRKQQLSSRRSASKLAPQFVGVTFDSRDRSWKARLSLSGKCRTIGSFSSEESAALAYCARLVQLYDLVGMGKSIDDAWLIAKAMPIPLTKEAAADEAAMRPQGLNLRLLDQKKLYEAAVRKGVGILRAGAGADSSDSGRDMPLKMKDKRYPPKKSRYIGTTWHRREGRWRTKISRNGKQIQLGTFRGEDEAGLCYARAKLEDINAQLRENSRSTPP